MQLYLVTTFEARRRAWHIVSTDLLDSLEDAREATAEALGIEHAERGVDRAAILEQVMADIKPEGGATADSDLLVVVIPAP